MKIKYSKNAKNPTIQTIWHSLDVLTKIDRKKLGLITIIQVFAGVLDLIGIALIGALGALVVSGLGTGAPGDRVNSLLRLINLDDFSFQTQTSILGLLAAFLFIAKTLFSISFTRRTLFFLSRRAGSVSTELVGKLLNQSLVKVQERSAQDHIFLVTTGVNTIMLGVLGSLVAIIADFSLLVIIALGLFIVDPIVAFATLILFCGIGFTLYWLMSFRASKLGNENADLTVKINDKIAEVLLNFRESVVKNRQSHYSSAIRNMRMNFADNTAEMQFMPMVSKYVIETSVVIGAVSISALQFILQNATNAVATLAIFMAAGSRIAPAVMRVQQGAIQVRSSIGAASSTLLFMEQLVSIPQIYPSGDRFDPQHQGFAPVIKISEVSFTYPGNTFRSLTEINLSIKKGDLVALVGPSGAGKSTLADLLLGLLEPDKGTVLMSGEVPAKALSNNIGAVGYVPQDVNIVNGTIRENISLGFDPDNFDDNYYWKLLELANLDTTVKSMPLGLDTMVGERGSKLSGGQRQRLGISRALFTNPKLVVLDEATSALDGETESAVALAIAGLKGRVTVIIIAHRLSTVRSADQVGYLDGGEVKYVGTFSQVREAVPDFDHQARLMGL